MPYMDPIPGAITVLTVFGIGLLAYRYYFLSPSSIETNANEGLEEASMNFDISTLPLFLERVSAMLSEGFPLFLVKEFMKPVEKMRVDEVETFEHQVMFKQSEAFLRIEVFMDDVDSPDVAFFTDNKNLAEAIRAEMLKFAEDLGI